MASLYSAISLALSSIVGKNAALENALSGWQDFIFNFITSGEKDDN